MHMCILTCMARALHVYTGASGPGGVGPPRNFEEPPGDWRPELGCCGGDDDDSDSGDDTAGAACSTNAPPCGDRLNQDRQNPLEGEDPNARQHHEAGTALGGKRQGS